MLMRIYPLISMYLGSQRQNERIGHNILRYFQKISLAKLCGLFFSTKIDPAVNFFAFPKLFYS